MTTGLLELLSRAKLQSNHHHQQTNIQFFTGRMHFLSPNQQCQSTEGKARKTPLGTPFHGKEIISTKPGRRAFMSFSV